MMGRTLLSICFLQVILCLYIPVPAFGRSIEETTGHSNRSVLNLYSKDQIHTNILQVGLISKSQPSASPCSPEKILDIETLLHLQTDVPDGTDHENEILLVGTFYLCTETCTTEGCAWRHNGPQISFNFKEKGNVDDTPNNDKRAPQTFPRKMTNEKSALLDKKLNNRNKRNTDATEVDVFVLGMTFEYESDKKRIEYDENGSPQLLENMEVKIRLFGKFDNDTHFKLTKFQSCDDHHNHNPVVKVIDVDPLGTMGEVVVKMPHLGELDEVFMCLKSSKMAHYVRQGDLDTEGNLVKPWLVIKLYQAMLPLWLHMSLLVILLILSGLFSGLNLGLMSLNKTDLKIIINTGTVEERKYAKAIAPVRNHGNFLLCCLLFSNVLVNASLTILVDDLTSGLIAILMSTLSIVIFGEIIPQAICSRFGLAVGAKTIYITKFFMIITSPLAFPLSKLLDKILGEEIGSFYTRERLKELLRVTKDYHGLEIEEVGIISGALDMKSKIVKDVMVRLENAFMLPIEALLDFETMADVEYHGYSRIPVYEEERSNIVGLLNVKQLTLLDANDKIPLKTVVEYYQNKLFFVFENIRLDYMFKTFREGSHGHMAFVQRINDEGSGDPFYETIGILTLEDVLEELLQAEIMDESDIGKHDARLANSVRPKDSAPFALMKRRPNLHYELPAPLALAAVQFLTTSVEPFSKEILSLSILQRLVANCAHYVKLPKHKGNLPATFLYEAGKPSEFFIILLEGRVEVIVGQEKLTYESGAFTTFGGDFLITGLAAEKSVATSPVTNDKTELKLKRRTFVPDYSVRAITDLHYLVIKYSAYKAAILATGIERANADPSKALSKNWQEEIDKMLERISAYDDDATSETSRRPRLSRDESFRAPNIALIDHEGMGRKTSILGFIGELGSENENEIANTIAKKYKTDALVEEIDDKVDEQTKLLPQPHTKAEFY